MLSKAVPISLCHENRTLHYVYSHTFFNFTTHKVNTVCKEEVDQFTVKHTVGLNTCKAAMKRKKQTIQVFQTRHIADQ